MRRSYRQTVMTLLAMFALSAGSSQMVFADLVVDYGYLSVSTSSSGYHSDLTYYNAGVDGSEGITPLTSHLAASTSDPALVPYFSGDTLPFGSADASITLTSRSLTIGASGSPGQIDSITSYYTTSSGVGFGSVTFHVAEDTPFTLVDTVSSSAWNFFVLFGKRNDPNDFQQPDYIYPANANANGTGWAGGSVQGTLYAAYTYTLSKQVQGFDYRNYWGSSGAVAGGFGEVTLTINTVPEPSSLALLGLGGIGLAISAYRRSRTTARSIYIID